MTQFERIYVHLRHTVPMDIDPDGYGEGMTREQIAEAASSDPDLMLEFGNGPHDVHDIDWEVETEGEFMEVLDGEHVFHTIRAEVKR